MSDNNCTNFCPPSWTGPWKLWHKGHGCNLDPDNVTVVDGFLRGVAITFPADGGEPTLQEGPRNEC